MEPEILDGNGIGKFPIYELVVFLVLIFITIFRRKLSSNDGYRSPSEENQSSSILDVIDIIIPVVPLPNTENNTIVSKHIIPHDGSITFDLLALDINILLNIVVYLNDSEIGKLAMSSKNLLKDACSDFVWKQLWIETFGAMWNHKKIVEIRMLR